MVQQRSKEEPKTSERLPVFLSFSIKEKQENMKDRSSKNSRVGLKNKGIHQRQIRFQKWDADRSPYKITEEGKTVDTDRRDKERIRKEKAVFPTGGYEAKNPEKMEALYAYVRSWGTEEESAITFTSWKGVDEYRYPVEPTSSSANFALVFTEVGSLLNSCI